MPYTAGQRILNRVRSHKKLRSSASEPSHRRQDSLASATSRPSTDSRDHYPVLEWDPLKLNPPVAVTPTAPRPIPPHHASFQERALRSQRPYAGHEPQRPRHGQSGGSAGSALEIHEGFDFGFEKEHALRSALRRNRADEAAHHLAHGWPSPASSAAGSDWQHDDDDGARPRSAWSEESSPPSPRRRPRPDPFGGPEDLLKRGGWKRRGIVFGGQADEVYAKEDDAFDLP